MAEKGGYKHFMQKEIFEQPRAVRDTLSGRISLDSGKVFLDEMDITEDEFREFHNVRIVACGTSWHAALAGKYMIERLAKIPVEVDYGSEFRYRDPIMGPETLCICISQSGETADTLAAQREAKQKGSKTLAICNVQGSMITREAAGTVLTHAGPEIGVASTKAFTSQLTALMVVALYLAQVRETVTSDCARLTMQELTRIPHKLETVLQGDESGIYDTLARELFRHTDFLYLGRGIHFPIALEGALKLKEISYIHAEGYPAGEMKHGPNALIDENLPVVVLATHDKNDPDIGDALRKEHLKHQGSKSARRHRDRYRHAGRPAREGSFRSRDRDSSSAGTPCADPGDCSIAIAGLPHRGAARLRRGSTAEPGKVGHRRIAVFTAPGGFSSRELSDLATPRSARRARISAGASFCATHCE